MFSCDEDDNPVSGSNEIDVDWVLVKTPDYNVESYVLGEVEIMEGVGYYFYYTSSSNIWSGTAPLDF